MYKNNLLFIMGTLSNLLLLMTPRLHPTINTRNEQNDLSAYLQTNVNNLKSRMINLEKHNRQLINQNAQLQRDMAGQAKESEDLRLQLQVTVREKNYLQKKLEDSSANVRRYETIARSSTDSSLEH